MQRCVAPRAVTLTSHIHSQQQTVYMRNCSTCTVGGQTACCSFGLTATPCCRADRTVAHGNVGDNARQRAAEIYRWVQVLIDMTHVLDPLLSCRAG